MKKRALLLCLYLATVGTAVVFAADASAAKTATGGSVPVCRVDGKPVIPEFSADRIGRLEGIVRKLVDQGVAPGAVLLVEQRGKTVVDFTYGMADRESARPMRTDALFRLYSMTKPVTSIAAMQLVARHRIGLDDPVAKYITEFADARVFKAEGQSEPLDRPITIRDLLRHTAGMTYLGDGDPVSKLYAVRGIPAGPGVTRIPSDGSPAVRDLADLVRRVATTPLRNQPGAAWTYGNADDVLGRVLEVATGKPLSAVLEEQVLRPTGMTATAFQASPLLAPRLTTAYIALTPKKAGEGVLASVDIDTLLNPALMVADQAEKSIFLAKPPIEYGGAGLVGTAGDYLRFTRMLRQGGTIDGRRLAPAWVVDQMRSNQIAPEARTKPATLGGLGFGLGFATRIEPTNMGPAFPQCGYFWGGAASTFFWIDPAGKTSGVLMTQVFGGDSSSFWLAVVREIYGHGSTGHHHN